ncbi:TPA_asm: ABC transporter [Listeria innocua]|nr:ABC transporter [Listeria innocua]EAH3474188.1 ABC transporter [Listeria monocytogenes]HAA7179744.1 ABC transporter [Listeria monocytogenes]HAA7182779.1 ABC transporter [Listeria monocytogenes]HAC3084298.1 ABC transporter [Listeria innocua]
MLFKHKNFLTFPLVFFLLAMFHGRHRKGKIQPFDFLFLAKQKGKNPSPKGAK